MKVEFYTTKYEWSHGKKPSGCGIWWFECLGEEFRVWARTYTEAKKEAAKIIRGRFSEITGTAKAYVMP